MNKKIFLLLLLVSAASQCMYSPISKGKKLENSVIKISNKASIPMTLEWYEYDSKGISVPMSKVFQPGEVATIKLGEVGGYRGGYHGDMAKVTYKPIPHNEAFQQEFFIDLPKSNQYGFTAVKLADILNNIWVPGVFKSDEKGNLTFQYKNMEPLKLERAMVNAGVERSVK